VTGRTPDGIAASVDSADFAEAHRELLADRSVQFDLPAFEPPPASGPSWLDRFLSTDHPVLLAILWAIAGAAVLFILYLIVRRMMGLDWPWQRPRPEAEEEDWRPDSAPARALLGEADGLAADGRYSEAAHLLLWRSIEDIDSRRPDLLRPALTSRDIAGLAAIPERPRGAFARIAMLVERSLFARRPLAEGDWRDCRSAYEEFAFAEGWRG
jgi:hypothetical protein